MLAAEMAKIPIFVTGGIGGVHREAEKSKNNLPWKQGCEKCCFGFSILK